ncbi:MAG TPA: right-handed parallel beta-helix repeat-containing protein [Candidatus Binataceae bacterium]|nr:right-handed parallel beta-helix repeat-containing protein [Candidatus Binataceae bacterium]
MGLDLFEASVAVRDATDESPLHEVIPHVRSRLALAAGGLLAAATLLVLGYFAPKIALAIGALIIAATLIRSVKVLIRTPIYLILMLIVIEEIPSLIPLDDSMRVLVRYSLYAILLTPAIPIAMRTGLLGRGCFRLYAVYFGWALVTISYSIAPAYSAARLVGSVLSFVALIAAIGQVNDESDASESLFLALLALSALMAILALAELVLPSSITWSHPVAGDPESFGVPRFKGLFENPNQVGAITLPSVTVGLVGWLRFTGLRRRWAGAAVVLGLILTLMADSRSVLVSIGAGCACYAIWRYRVKGFVACVAVALGAFVLLATFESDYFFRGAGTLTGRTDIWHFTIARMWERPLLGYGYQVDGAIFGSRYFPIWWGPWYEGPRSSLHNEYLSRAIGLGIPALALWLFMTLRPFHDLFRRNTDTWNLKPAFLLIVVPMLIRSMAEADVSDCIFPSGVTLALVWALAERGRLLTLAHEPAEATSQTVSHLASALAGAVLFGVIFTGIARSASARTYYIDASGTDSNPGTDPATPWRSLAKVSNAVLAPGDVVALKAGDTWRGTLALHSSGAVDHPITITRYGSGPPPIISGADVISGWRLEHDGVWSAPCESPAANVYVGSEWGWGLNYSPSNGDIAPGGWRWEAGRLFLHFPRDAQPTSQTIEAAVREDGIIVDGAHPNNNGVPAISYSYSGGNGGRTGTIESRIGHIVVDGIEVRRTAGWGIHFYDSINPVVRNCTVHETGPGRRDIKYHNAIHVDLGPGARFENNTIAYSGGHGNAINCQRADGARIAGNQVQNWFHNGLDIKESTGVVVTGNTAHDSVAGSGVYGEFDRNLTVSGNTIRNVVTGVQANLGTSATITGNFILGASTAIYVGPRGATVTISDNCAAGVRFALIDAGQDAIVEDDNAWGSANVKLGQRIFEGIAEYQRAGYGTGDRYTNASCP